MPPDVHRRRRRADRELCGGNAPARGRGVVTVLNRLHANIIGVVLNRASSNTSSDGYYYGYYRYGYEQKAKS